MLFLDELLEKRDFRSAVQGLARDFRREHEMPEIRQLGLAVPDVEAAAARLEARGIGPFFIASGAPAFWKERGEDREFFGKLGFAYHHGIEFELLGPGEGSDFYRNSLDPEGRIVVQHLGMIVKDVDAAAAGLSSAGYPVIVQGRIKSGLLAVDFAYMDTVRETSLVLEFISWKIAEVSVSIPGGLFHLLGRVEKAIGKRSLSM